jgi:hypothetical protein
MNPYSLCKVLLWDRTIKKQGFLDRNGALCGCNLRHVRTHSELDMVKDYGVGGDVSHT